MIVQHFKPFPQMDTERLHLRQLLHKDAVPLSLLRSDDEVNKYLDRPKKTTPEEAKAFIEMINAGIAREEWLYWAVCIKEEEELIGAVCLWNFSDDKLTAEIGYELMTEFRGRGLIMEALVSIIDYAKNSLLLHTILAFTHVDNARSSRLLLKNGFTADTAHPAGETSDFIRMKLLF